MATAAEGYVRCFPLALVFCAALVRGEEALWIEDVDVCAPDTVLVVSYASRKL